MGQPDASQSDVTLLLQSAEQGDAGAAQRLIDAVHHELRAMAEARMRQERPGHTLQPTALVNEAYLRLAGGGQRWEGRAHFFGAAAQAMQRVLIDHARQRLAQKRGRGGERVTLHDLNVASEAADLDLLALDEALNELEKSDDRLARVVRLRYFAGLTVEEVADLLRVSVSTVKRDWTYARAWLYERLEGDGE